jgi:hypothetical protein
LATRPHTEAAFRSLADAARVAKPANYLSYVIRKFVADSHHFLVPGPAWSRLRLRLSATSLRAGSVLTLPTFPPPLLPHWAARVGLCRREVGKKCGTLLLKAMHWQLVGLRRNRNCCCRPRYRYRCGTECVEARDRISRGTSYRYSGADCPVGGEEI